MRSPSRLSTLLARAAVPATLALASLWLAPMSASAEQVKFGGPHPIPEAVEGDFCYIELPHVHVYTPDHAEPLYREHDEQHYFVGDPVAHGYDGDNYTYYGHHPIELDASVYVDVHDPVVEYCYLDGPHFHHYAPPADISFELKGGAYWYIGKYPRPYHRHKKKLRRINVVYEPIVYTRPVVTVEAPTGYLGPVVDVDVDVAVPAATVEVDGPPGHAHGHGRGRAGASVRGGLDVDVHIPVPSVSIDVSVPGVVVHERHRHHRKHKKFKKHGKHKHRGKHRGRKRGWRN